MRFKIFVYAGAAVLVLMSTSGLFSDNSLVENKAPNVVITKPANGATLPWNSLVPYTILVDDPEDGSSEYEEIAVNQVLLLVNYFSKPADAEKFLNQNKSKMPQPLLQMSKSTCLLCHASKAKLIGPSFDLIAERYSNEPAVIEALSKKVISGSTGTWGELVMPTHPNMEIGQIKQMVSWILENGSNPNQTFYVGTAGAFRTIPKPNGAAGVYSLTAGYADNGISGALDSKKQGEQTVLLKVE